MGRRGRAWLPGDAISVDGFEDVEALAGSVGEAGGGFVGGAVRQGERYFVRWDPGGEEVEGHADFGPEAGGDAAPEGLQGAREEGALAGKWFQGRVARASGDGAARVALDEAEAPAGALGERGNARGMVLVQSLHKLGQVNRRGAEVRVREEYRFFRGVPAGGEDAGA